MHGLCIWKCIPFVWHLSSRHLHLLLRNMHCNIHWIFFLLRELHGNVVSIPHQRPNGSICSVNINDGQKYLINMHHCAAIWLCLVLLKVHVPSLVFFFVAQSSLNTPFIFPYFLCKASFVFLFLFCCHTLEYTINMKYMTLNSDTENNCWHTNMKCLFVWGKMETKSKRKDWRWNKTKEQKNTRGNHLKTSDF